VLACRSLKLSVAARHQNELERSRTFSRLVLVSSCCKTKHHQSLQSKHAPLHHKLIISIPQKVPEVKNNSDFPQKIEVGQSAGEVGQLYLTSVNFAGTRKTPVKRILDRRSLLVVVRAIIVAT
jgi:hypothetical protein